MKSQITTVLLAIGLIFTPAQMAHAQGLFGWFSPDLPPEVLEQRVSDFSNRINTLSSNIDDTLSKLDSIQNLNRAENRVEATRIKIEGVLDILAQGGTLDLAVANNITWMNDNRVRILQRRDLSEDQMTKLVEAWDTYIHDAHELAAELTGVRSQLSERLTQFKQAEGLLEELIILGSAGEANQAIEAIIQDFNAFISYIDSISLEYQAPSIS